MKVVIKIMFLISICIFSGCCSHRFCPQENPDPIPECVLPERIRLAIVLGGGGVKGLAHLGVLEEFEKANIPIDLIVGCSAGGLVGALYSDHPHASCLITVLEPMKTAGLLDINIWTARYGLSQGRSMQRVLKANLSTNKFEDLKIPLILVATDLYTGDLVTIGGGEIIAAVQASCAVPFIYAPVELHGRVLVDGGVIDPVPARIARKVDSEVIVVVDLRGLLEKTIPTNLFGIAARSAEISLLWQGETCLQDADVVIRPELGGVGMFEDRYNRQIYEAGKVAAKAAIPQVKQKLLERENRRNRQIPITELVSSQ